MTSCYFLLFQKCFIIRFLFLHQQVTVTQLGTNVEIFCPSFEKLPNELMQTCEIFQIYTPIPVSDLLLLEFSNEIIDRKPSQKQGFLLFFYLLFSVDGGWCEWSSWTPCSKTCGAQWVSRYRSCACPVPVAGGACPDQQEEHQGLGVQIERKPCTSVTFCPGDTHIYCRNTDDIGSFLRSECTEMVFLVVHFGTFDPIESKYVGSYLFPIHY